MNRFNRTWIYFGLSVSAVAASAVLVGMTNHKEPTPNPKRESKPVPGFSNKELSAKDTLKDQLTRRFTDRQNVDFGMSRVIREGSRLHDGPTMNITPLLPTYRRNKTGGYELKVEDKWVSSKNVRPMMTPENDAETQAIQTLKDSGVQVAIYTVGQFDRDQGQNPTPKPIRLSQGNPHMKNFDWGKWDGFRAKGPAYITQDTEIAPRAFEIVDFGRKAWASGEEDFVLQDKDGWTYFAHRVSAPDKSCGSCHGPGKKSGAFRRSLAESTMKAGDSVGLFVIAMKHA